MTWLGVNFGLCQVFGCYLTFRNIQYVVNTWLSYSLSRTYRLDVFDYTKYEGLVHKVCFKYSWYFRSFFRALVFIYGGCIRLSPSLTIK